MNLVKLKCDNCGADLELDLDNIQAFCQFCGSKLMIDMEHLSELLKEKEKTKQVKEIEEQKTKRESLKYEHELNKNKETLKVLLIVFAICFIGPTILTIIMFLIGIIFGAK